MKSFIQVLVVCSVLIWMFILYQNKFANSTNKVHGTLNITNKWTNYNKEYDEKMLLKRKVRQESKWGFQEVLLENKVEHTITSIAEYISLIETETSNNNWSDNKVHIINFEKGEYIIPLVSRYYVLLVPSQTIIEGAGIGKTVFKATNEIDKNDDIHFRRLFNLEYATHDIVVRGISFYNETRDNKWGLFHSNGIYNRENYLFENIEFDDVFGAIGKNGFDSNFITFRGLRKRLGNTSQRIKKYFTTPIPMNYQFYSLNSNNVELAGQIGVRTGNSVVFHDCKLGDNISATIDIFSNYIEIVGVSFIDPLLDHSIKAPSANHLYIHDSSFELSYTKKLIQDSYWNPTFFTHEGGNLINYHFKNLVFKRKGEITAQNHNGHAVFFVQSEPFSIYDNRANNISGDMVWEEIAFNGYSNQHRVVGYPKVDKLKGFEAINYTSLLGVTAQMKEGNNIRGNYVVEINKGVSSSKEDIKGVYSWGDRKNGLIDYPRDNRLFTGTKSDSNRQPYIIMYRSTMKDFYNKNLSLNVSKQ